MPGSAPASGELVGFCLLPMSYLIFLLWLVFGIMQNGSLVVFDMRQTASPIATLKGPSSSPMHTVQYVPEHPMLKEGSGLLTASSSSLLFWPSATSSGYQSEGSR